MGFQTVCKPKIPFHVSCKTVGEKLAYCSFPSLSLSTTPFLLKKKNSAFGSYCLQQENLNTPQPYILLIFSLYSNRTQLAKAIILPLAVEMFKSRYKTEKLWEHSEWDRSNICI